MATNLLLEGDDLEALLIKAHSEGGPNARIVRADKYRHGGLWGFFARERFEVAVEIPEPTRPDGEGSAFFVPSPTTPAQAPAAQALVAPAAPAAQAPVPAPAPAPSGRHAVADGRVASRYADEDADEAPSAPRQAGVAAAERLVDQLTAHLAEEFAAGPARSLEPPTPAAFAADGLLGIVDRVSAAERAATRAVQARAAHAAHAARHIDLPVGATELEPRPAELVGAGRVAGAAHRTMPAATSTWSDSPSSSGSPSDRDATPTNGTVTSAMNGFQPTTAPAAAAAPAGATEPTTPASPTTPPTGPTGPAASSGPAAGVPHEPGLSPVRPSTSRPEFTALLDTLRDGARPGRSARPAAPRPDVATGADDDAVTEPLTLRFDPPRADRPATPTAPAPAPAAAVAPAPAEDLVFDVMPPVERAAARPVHIPAQAGPSPSEQDDEELPEVGVRQNDPRTTADRRTLRALGVPAAWTRLLRPGDRFAEVLRMLERMPEEDIDPAATIVAVVGPADTVRLEAHRTALDLAVGGEPRPVVVVPATVGTDRAAAVARALRSGPVVLAVEADGDDAALVLDTLTTVQAGGVIAVVDATVPLDRTQRWLDALGQVDALVLDGATEVTDPAAVLQLGLPVVRLDGIPVDRVTWAAVLCAQLMAAEQAVAER